MHLETVVVSPFPFVTASRGIGKPPFPFPRPLPRPPPRLEGVWAEERLASLFSRPYSLQACLLELVFEVLGVFFWSWLGFLGGGRSAGTGPLPLPALLVDTIVQIIIRLVVLVASLYMSGLDIFGTHRRAFMATTPSRVEALPAALCFEALFPKVFC